MHQQNDLAQVHERLGLGVELEEVHGVAGRAVDHAVGAGREAGDGDAFGLEVERDGLDLHGLGVAHGDRAISHSLCQAADLSPETGRESAGAISGTAR